MSVVVGCGTKFYGSLEKLGDGSYITTKWITLFYIPILPVGSCRVIKRNSAIYNAGYVITESTEFSILEFLRLNLLQVISVYAAIFIICAWAAMFISVAAHVDIDNNMVLQIVMISTLILSPGISFVYARKANRNPVGWALAGFFLPVIPIILVTVVPSRNKK